MQRVNGRIAMWGFAAGVAAELGSHESIVQQAAGHPFGVTFFMLLISVASIMPKFASGVPIGVHAFRRFKLYTEVGSRAAG